MAALYLEQQYGQEGLAEMTRVLKKLRYYTDYVGADQKNMQAFRSHPLLNDRIAAFTGSQVKVFDKPVRIVGRNKQGDKVVTQTAQRLLSLFQKDQARLQQTGRAAGSALRVHQVLQERPIASLQELANRAELSFPAVTSGMQILEKLGVARELTGNKRNRLFGYDQYLAILGEGTEVP